MPSLPYQEIHRIYQQARTGVHDYLSLLAALQANDVVLSVHPPIPSLLRIGTPFYKARIRNLIHACLDCITLRNNPHRGTYLHAEWVVGWLRRDRLLEKVFDSVCEKQRKLLFSSEFLQFVNQRRPDAASFPDLCVTYLKEPGRRLGPGINTEMLDRSCANGDILLTASLKRTEYGAVQVLKMFGGHRARSVIWGSAAPAFSGVDLTPHFV